MSDFRERLTAAKGGTKALEDAADRLENEVREALWDDLNAPNAMGALFEFIRTANKELDAGGSDVGAVRRAREVLGSVLVIVPEAVQADSDLASWVVGLLADRAAGRARRDFAAADAIRKTLDERGIVIEDTAGGTRWKSAR